MFCLYSQPKFRQLARYQKVYVLKLSKDCFTLERKIPYNLRQSSQFHIHPVRAVFSGTENIKLLDPKIGEIMPGEMKKIESPWEFKRATKQWKPKSYPCRLCR